MKIRRMTNQVATVRSASTQEPALPTFMDHLQELKSRFFWIAIYFVVASGVAYPFFQLIVHILTAPLQGQKLYYLTPGGGLAFILKVCMYVGVIAILPVIMYHFYRFVAPVMKKNNARSVLGYTIASSLLAVIGIVFAYMVTLPAAIQFLTNINIDQISSMLTIDAYMSFVIGYIVAGALLFQLPLVMLIINSVTPLPPRKLMNYQRHMIVVSFVAAAIVSPTPDVVNQTILAAPMVVMYQIGIVAVWARNRRRAIPALPVATAVRQAEPVVVPHSQAPVSMAEPQPRRRGAMDMVVASSRRPVVSPRQRVRPPTRTRTLEGIHRAQPSAPLLSTQPMSRGVPTTARQAYRHVTVAGLIPTI